MGLDDDDLGDGPQPGRGLVRIGAPDMNRLHVRAAPGDLIPARAAAIEQDRHGLALEAPVERQLLSRQQLLQPRQAVGLYRLRHLVGLDRGRRARPAAVLEGIGLGELDLADQLQGVLEIVVGLARMADDEVRRQRDVGAGVAQAVDDLAVLVLLEPNTKEVSWSSSL